MHDEFFDGADVSAPLLNRMVEDGLLCRKTGGGFYDYAGPTPVRAWRSRG
jgi:3-hydroxyacyl-CoA dehydrogenase